MKLKYNKKAFTIVEISVGLVVASLILVVIMKLFSTGMTGSQKGLSHLANMEAANILMSQIEYDVTRAHKISDPAIGSKASSARWTILSDEAEETTVIYQIIGENVKRSFVEKSSTKDHTYARGLKTEISFERVEFVDKVTKAKKEGMWINLTIASPKQGVGKLEKFTLKRLIMSKNII